jgi:hypothetical protein
MAALRKADALVSYDNSADSFIISYRNGNPIFSCPFEPKRNQWVLPHAFIPSDDPSGNGQPLFHFFHTSLSAHDVPTVSTSPSEPVNPMPIDSLDTVDDVSHANKKNRVLPPSTTDAALSPSELSD